MLAVPVGAEPVAAFQPRSGGEARPILGAVTVAQIVGCRRWRSVLSVLRSCLVSCVLCDQCVITLSCLEYATRGSMCQQKSVTSGKKH